jgi:type II secretory pathway component PulL
MNALKAYFLSRLFREKLLLVVIAGLVALTFLSNFSGRVVRAWRTQRTTSVALADEQQWLANRAAIEAAANQAVKNLDPARTLDDTQLVGELNALARAQGLKFTSDTPRTERTGQFAVHTVQFNLIKMDWNALKGFYLELTKRSPYISLEQFSLQAERSNPGLLNASLKVSSVEIVH